MKTPTKFIKRQMVLASLICLAITGFSQVGVHTDFPDNSSAMDIVATDKGLLIPRVTLSSSLASPSPVTSPATGLMVFNSGANQPIGFYYWDGAQWVAIGSGGSGAGDYWSLLGNAGTSIGTNFLGTTDANDLAIRTNNAERMRFEPDGQVLIGSTTPIKPADLFTVTGNATQNYAVNVYSPYSGVYTQTGFVGVYNIGGFYGMYSRVDTATGFGIYCRNMNTSGYSFLTAGSGSSALILSGRSAGISSTGSEGIISMGKSTLGWGLITSGSNKTPATLTGRSGGVAAVGDDGIFAGSKSATGRGVIAGGNNTSNYYLSAECEGGAFTGWHGIFARTTNADGIGIIGIGSAGSSYTPFTGGAGGTFTGQLGLYAKGTAAEGMGVIGVGSNGASYYTIAGGSGGSFAGYHGLLSVGTNTTNGTGIIGAGNGAGYTVYANGSGGSFSGLSAGVVGYASTGANSTGVIGAGSSFAPATLSSGSGGAFTGNNGVYAIAYNATGTGVIGVGNSLASMGSYPNGSGGAFTGASAGVVSWAQSGANGIGVIGAGNNTAPITPSNGAGGAFTGTSTGVSATATSSATGVGVMGSGNNITTPTVPAVGGGGSFTGTVGGVFGYTTTTGNITTYGGYFQTGGATSYAYVGYRNGAPWTNYKIAGNGSVATIVKNTTGDRIMLTCPEAPEVVFQDFGIGQLVNGQAHITIDPDLAININVSEDHPLKVYITPEGDCNGVYVTNKSANGFDVIELMGGQSNVPFSWQIVATRADEETVLRDGSVVQTVYSQRFAPAPGPLESFGVDTQVHENSDAGPSNRVVKHEKVTQFNEIIPVEKQNQVIQAVEEKVIREDEK